VRIALVAGVMFGLMDRSLHAASLRYELIRLLNTIAIEAPFDLQVASLDPTVLGQALLKRRHQLDAFDLGARQLGLDMLAVQARRTEDFAAAFDSLDRARVDALYVVQDGVTILNEVELANRARQRHMAMLCARSDWVERGCLMSYGSNSAALTEQQVNYVDKILRGARPGDLPIQLPTVFDLSVNTATLQALGLTIPASATPLVTEWIT
jgi:ABC-type uncharacterized transport system substrate-binding protein